LSREPLAYIIGEKDFWSLPFAVSPGVLIPRPETELLIEKFLSLVDDCSTFRGSVLDLGVGSGIIATVLALELPGAEIVGVDLSSEALAVASRNLQRHGVGSRVSLVKGNWLNSIGTEGKFDFIVSNPPYVASSWSGRLQPELGFEPGLALYAGEDGMTAYNIIVPPCHHYLKPGGHLLFEIGADQEEMITKLFNTTPHLELLEIGKDYGGHPRTVVAKAVD